MDKEQMAIARIQEAARMSEKFYGKPLIVTTSGGKDSCVCVELARRSGVPFEIMHNHTTADAPETVRFLREEFKRLEESGIPADRITVNYPSYRGKRTSMWALIPIKLMPPTRLARYCCEILKEYGGQNRYIVTGVRWAESVSRQGRGVFEGVTKKKEERIILNNDNDDKRRLTEHCMQQNKTVCNPIIDWTDRDVWDFIDDSKIPVNPMYRCGFDRVGCIGCPMAGTGGAAERVCCLPWLSKAIYPLIRQDACRAQTQESENRLGRWRRCVPLVDGGRRSDRANQSGGFRQ